MEKTITPYLEMANEIIEILQKDGTLSFGERIIVIALVVNKLAETAVEYGNEKQAAVNNICKAIRGFCE